MTKVAVLGGGNGGFAAAADLSRRGFSVTLYNRSTETIASVRQAGGISYEGVLGSGFAPLAATTDIAEAVGNCALIEICAPATAHRYLAAGVAAHLRPDVPILVNPGGMLGSPFFVQEAFRGRYRQALLIGET